MSTDMENNQDSKDYDIKEGHIILFKGFPPETGFKDIEDYIKDVCEYLKIKVISKKSNFYTFAFVYFENAANLHKVLQKKHYYKGIQLETKLPLDRDEHIKQSVQDLREPRKIFVDKIPKGYTANDIKSIFGNYGKIVSINMFFNNNKPINQANITFQEHHSSLACVTKHSFGSKKDKVMTVYYAQPKFSEYMLLSVDARIRSYIRDVQKRKKYYNPREFQVLHDVILEEEKRCAEGSRESLGEKLSQYANSKGTSSSGRSNHFNQLDNSKQLIKKDQSLIRNNYNSSEFVVNSSESSKNEHQEVETSYFTSQNKDTTQVSYQNGYYYQPGNYANQNAPISQSNDKYWENKQDNYINENSQNIEDYPLTVQNFANEPLYDSNITMQPTYNDSSYYGSADHNNSYCQYTEPTHSSQIETNNQKLLPYCKNLQYSATQTNYVENQSAYYNQHPYSYNYEQQNWSQPIDAEQSLKNDELQAYNQEYWHNNDQTNQNFDPNTVYSNYSDYQDSQYSNNQYHNYYSLSGYNVNREEYYVDSESDKIRMQPQA